MNYEARKMLSAEEVASICNVSVSYGYKLISRLNRELTQKGYIIIHGKVDEKYFYRRVFTEVN